MAYSYGVDPYGRPTSQQDDPYASPTGVRPRNDGYPQPWSEQVPGQQPQQQSPAVPADTNGQQMAQQPANQANPNPAGAVPQVAPAAMARYTPYQYARPATLPTYTPGQLTRFAAPDDRGVGELQGNMVRQVLEHPETLTPEAIAAMREKSKEEALAYQTQAQDQIGRDAVQRGVYGTAGADRRLASDVIDKLISGNRAIDLQKVGQDRQDQLGASQLAEQFLTGGSNRAVQQFGAQHQGEMDQEGLNQAGVQSQIQALLNGQQFDRNQADENYRGFQANAQQDQFLRQLGYNYTALDAQQRQALINAALNG